MERLRTALCGLLEIEYPIVQSGMGAVAGPELVAEVCEAGGLGILALLNQPVDVVREGIRKVRALTRRPFGVNLWLHQDIRPPADPAGILADNFNIFLFVTPDGGGYAYSVSRILPTSTWSRD